MICASRASFLLQRRFRISRSRSGSNQRHGKARFVSPSLSADCSFSWSYLSSDFQTSTIFCLEKEFQNSSQLHVCNTAPHIHHEIDQSNSSRQSGLWAVLSAKRKSSALIGWLTRTFLEKVFSPGSPAKIAFSVTDWMAGEIKAGIIRPTTCGTVLC
jgi:hypothetical protein